MAKHVDIKLLGEAPTPSLLKLKIMEGADGNPLRIIPRIAAGDYMTFGMCLLQDENGVDVGLLKKTHFHDGPVGITDAIIQKWLTSSAPTRTYQHLIECLRQSELSALAEEITNILATGTLTTTHGTKQVTTVSSVSHNSVSQDMLSSPITSANLLHVPSTTIQASSPQIASYASYLKRVYTHLSQSYTSQNWTRVPQSEYVHLAMITSKELRRGGPEEEMVRLAQQGKIETIMSDKISTDFESLLLTPLVVLPPPKCHRVMLIEGAPGGGKSTLALHICHKWTQDDSFLAQFDIVVLAYLRDEAIQNASTLADILPVSTSQSVSDVATQIINSNGIRVLFIFDGWDEFPTELQKESFISTIIREPYKHCLDHSTVIITTRPVSSGNLLRIADQRVEILGFTQHQIHEYIEKALDGDKTRIQKLVQHLKDHPVIEGYCYIPLHVAMLVHIFLGRNEVLPTTLHELFQDLVLCRIAEELKRQKSDQNLDTELSSFNDLPGDFKSHQLTYLSTIAYEGVMHDKVIFYKNDLKALNMLHAMHYPAMKGILQAVEGIALKTSDVSRSYNFLHLSVQELFAAYHISQMNPSTQVEVFKELFGSSRFEAVLHYYCGFTKLDNPAIQDFISTYSSQQTSFEDILPLLHCFFEAQQPRLAQGIDQKFTDVIDLKFLAVNPVDYIVVGYFVSSLLSMSTSNGSNFIELKIGDNVNDYLLKLLLSQFSWHSIGRWLKVYMHKTSITGEGVQLIASHHLKQPSVISELSIVGVDNIQSGENGLLHIAEALQTNCHLTKLKLGYMDLNCIISKNSSALTKMLCKNKTLTHLDLFCNRNFSDSGAHCIFQGLQQNTTLIHLNLEGNGITGCKDTAQVLKEMLLANKTLTHLNLSGNKIFYYSDSRFILEGLQHNTTLVHLNLATTGISAIGETPQTLAEMLQVNTSLTHLNLSCNFEFSFGTRFIFETLQHNTTLSHLDLSQTGMGNKGIIPTNYIDIQSTFQALNGMLKMNNTLAYLNLSLNGIPDSNTCSIFQALQHNTALVHLDLHGAINISDEVAVCIAEALDSNRSLQVLDIHSNQIGNIRFDWISKLLESTTTLRELYLDVHEFNCGETTVNYEKVQAIHRLRQEKGLHHVVISAK